MNLFKDYRHVVELFVQVSNQYAELYKKPLKYGSDTEVSLSELQVLEKVIESESVNLTTLAGLLGISKPAVIKSTRKLIEKGVIIKFQLKDNNKETHFRASEHGVDIYEKYQLYIYEQVFKDVHKLFDESPAEFEGKLTELLNIVNQFYNMRLKKDPES